MVIVLEVTVDSPEVLVVLVLIAVLMLMVFHEGMLYVRSGPSE